MTGIGRSRWTGILAWSAALVVVTAGLAAAAIPASDGTITGCYTIRTGALRIIDGTQTCASKTEIRLSWPSSAVKTMDLGADGHIWLTYTDSTRRDLGPVPAVRDAAIDDSEHLVVTYTDGSTRDLGNVQGPPGPPLGSLDSLAGLPCMNGAGVTVVAFGSGVDAPVSITCRNRAFAVLTVHVHTPAGDPTFQTAVEISTSVGIGGRCGGMGLPSLCTYELAMGTQVEAVVSSPFDWTWGGACATTSPGQACSLRLEGAATIEVIAAL